MSKAALPKVKLPKAATAGGNIGGNFAKTSSVMNGSFGKGAKLPKMTGFGTGKISGGGKKGGSTNFEKSYKKFL